MDIRQTDRQVDSMTDPAQRAESVINKGGASYFVLVLPIAMGFISAVCFPRFNFCFNFLTDDSEV